MNDYIGILLICIGCILFIVAYGTYRCKHTSFVDPLTIAFAPPPFDKYFDGWGLSHLGFFYAFGVFVSKQTILFLYSWCHLGTH